ncbi:MAG: Rid family hydrolase [Alloprevotella sp.]
MKKSHCFHILLPRTQGSFLGQCDDLLLQFENLLKKDVGTLERLLQARFYLSDASNQKAALESHRLFELLRASGVASTVEQPPLHPGVKVALLLWLLPEPALWREIIETPEGQCAQIEAEGLTYVVQSVRPTAESAATASAELQMEQAFRKHIETLDACGMNLKNHCQRTWIYVRDVDRNYAGVVAARNHVFEKQGLTPATHFIASTGIGGATANPNSLVAADFFSVKGLKGEQVKYMQALEYLNPTHEYGVAFERGTRLDLPSGSLYLVSGTASIDKDGQCVHRGDVLTQTGRLFLNIEKLLDSTGAALSDIQYIIVYLRDVADYPQVQQYLCLRFPGLPCLITEARVCRPEWLIEVECMAFRAKD